MRGGVQNSQIWLSVSLDVSRRHLWNQPQNAVLEVVFLGGIATAQTALLNVDRLGVIILVRSVIGDETSLAVVAVDLKRRQP
jgi:hypothetical protein